MNLTTINIVETFFKTPKPGTATDRAINLSPGQELRGEVVGILPDGRTRIDFGSFQALADLPVPMKSGQGLWVRVDSAQPQLKFSQISAPNPTGDPFATPSTGISQTASGASTAPRIDTIQLFATARSLLSQLQSIAATPPSEGDPSPTTGLGRAMESLANLIEHFKPLNPENAGVSQTAAQIQRLVEDSGHFLGQKIQRTLLHDALQAETSKASLGKALDSKTWEPAALMKGLGALNEKLQDFWGRFGSGLLKQMDPASGDRLQQQTQTLMRDLSRVLGLAAKNEGLSGMPTLPASGQTATQGMPPADGATLQTPDPARNLMQTASQELSGRLMGKALTLDTLPQWIRQADRVSGQWRDQIEMLITAQRETPDVSHNSRLVAARHAVGAVRETLSQLMHVIRAPDAEQKTQATETPARDLGRLATTLQRDLRPHLVTLNDMLDQNETLGPLKNTKEVVQMQRMVKEMLDDLQHQFRQNAGKPSGPDQMHVYTHWIPLQNNPKGAALKLFYAPPKGDQKRTGFKASILLELDHLGFLRTDVSLAESSLNVSFFASSRKSEQVIHEYMDDLQQVLQASFEAVSLSVRLSEEKTRQFDQQSVAGEGDSLLNVRI